MKTTFATALAVAAVTAHGALNCMALGPVGILIASALMFGATLFVGAGIITLRRASA